MPQYSLFSLTPSKTAKRPRPISKHTFVFGIGTTLYAIAGLMDLWSYWSNVNDEEDDEFGTSLTESFATPIAALASFCYIIMSVMALTNTPSSLRLHHHHQGHKHRQYWWQTLLEEQLQVRAEYTLQFLFLIGSILLFAAEELKTHKIMRSVRKQQRTSQWCFILSLHLFWLSTYGLYKVIPTESDVSKDKADAEEQEETAMAVPPVNSEGSLEKCGRLLLLMGTTIELSMIYIEYGSKAKVSTASILLGTFVSALLWWTYAILKGMTERYYYPDSLDNAQADDNIVDFSFEDAMNLPDRLRQRLQAHRRHVTHIRVV